MLKKIKPVLRQSGKRRYSTEIKEGYIRLFVAGRVDRGRWLAAVYTGLSYRPGTG